MEAPPPSTTTLFRPIKPHFMQPLVPGFHTNFGIPKEFIKYIEDGQLGNAKLVILRDRSLKTWYVQIGCDGLSLGHGWEKFCIDHNMQIGDFVVFKHHGNLMFDVTVLDPSTCERQLPITNKKQRAGINTLTQNHPKGTSNQYGLMREEEDDEEPLHIEFPSFNYEHPYFRYVVKQSNLKNGVVILPIDFVRKNGLTNRWCDINLQDQKNKTWRMKLRCDRTKKDGGNNYYIYCKSRFYDAYNIDEDDALLFELIDADAKVPLMKFYKKKRLIS